VKVVGVIGIVGGTGPQGRGLALRLRESGHHVLIGSRDAERAQVVVAALPAPVAAEPGRIVGVDNARAAREGEVVIVATPWDGFEAIGAACADALAGKLVICCANPLRFDGDGPMPVRLPEGSAAELLQHHLPAAVVVGGFQNVSAITLGRLSETLEGDVLLCGDDEHAVARAADVVRAVGDLRPLHAGPLRMSAVAEDLTALLISVNRRYRSHAGVALTGVEPFVGGDAA
jgi:NADPH-dependent F420 reductase